MQCHFLEYEQHKNITKQARFSEGNNKIPKQKIIMTDRTNVKWYD